MNGAAGSPTIYPVPTPSELCSGWDWPPPMRSASGMGAKRGRVLYGIPGGSLSTRANVRGLSRTPVRGYPVNPDTADSEEKGESHHDSSWRYFRWNARSPIRFLKLPASGPGQVSATG